MSREKPIRGFDVTEDVHLARIMVYCVPAGFVMGGFAGLKLGHPILGAVAGTVIMGGAGYLINRYVIAGTANAIGSMLVPDARGGGGESYSHIDALEMKGDLAGALAAWEKAVAASPNAIAARINGADLHARKGKNPARASELFREVVVHPNATAETQRYAAQRLIDLYLGPLADEGRALVELRRLVDRWPDTPEGKGARSAIARIKSERET